MEATIVEVMESWPLQLILEADGRYLHVQLSEDARILEGGRQIGVGALLPGRRVWVDAGTGRGPGAGPPRTVALIKILD